MKKVISFMLCCTMLMAMLVPAFAVSPERTLIEDMNRVAEFVTSDEEAGRLDFRYMDADGNLAAGYGTKEIERDGTVKLTFSEGDKRDVVLIKENGAIYLNGEEVEVITQDDTNSNEIVPFAHQIKYYDNPPGNTKASEYTKLINTKKSDIRLKQALLDLTESGFIAIVVAALGFNPLGGFAAGELMSRILNVGGTVHPDGIHAVSVITYSYQRQSGPTVAGYGTVTKLHTKWYASPSQKNYISGADTVVYRSMRG